MDHINTDIEFDDQLIPEESKGQEKTASSQDAFIPKEGNAFAEEETTTEETTASIENIEAGEFSVSKEEEKEEVQQLHTKHPQPEVPVIDHRLLAGKLSVYDWLNDLPSTDCAPEIVEVRFKNTRKGFYSNPSHLPLKEGDIVAVEAALGHDIGVISLSGELVKEQIRAKRIDLERNPLKKVYRKAKPHDIEKWQQAIALEHDTMIRSRKIAADLKLNMKIGDVEYQGDKTKAIFYYIADDRVDFRTLIKVLAETFRIRIEMKQIGTRQEAGRIGGIGPCGRKLCCSTFITNFVSVSTSAARYQDISLNPQKLAGQCGKLKCCLNYEVDAYIDAQKDFPPTNIALNTGDGLLYHQKTDIFGRIMSFTPDKEGKGIFIQIPVDRVKEIIALNRKGIIPPKAVEDSGEVTADIKYTDGVGEESLSRFDEKKQKKRHSRHRNNNNRENGNNNGGRNEKTERNEGNNNRNENKGGDHNRPQNQHHPRNNSRSEQRKDQRPFSRPRPKPDQNTQPQNDQ
ncbi:regulatory iron-sulfur-containing complex subunit RicT [Odoribacter sp. Z80]|uniref:PSP1 domain-containing protein n=1 Tax=Odoribacter sp. Z80 TaxID=2304575 RepID=UPI00137A42D4|nr:regulatory iron-sulfur-containing complex subunit RicT [Odoribacter sp. Z80]NCE72549.1 hypothetical protein [Odoribacter sp. Z80]